MYVTRPLSTLLRDPSALSLPPPEGPNSGILVIQDDEEVMSTCCFGLCKRDQLKNLPFPQNKNLEVMYSDGNDDDIDRVIFIPVINQPLSSNLYYCIERHGKHKGEAYKNSKEEDKAPCCFWRRISDLKPETLDHHDIYQQFEIQRRKWSTFVAKSVASDGFPPYFLRREGWTVHSSSTLEYELSEAKGLDKNLRARLPELNLSLSERNSTGVVVGKWHCPFMFIKDGTLQDQIDSSRYYEMKLEQYWEQIFACENRSNSEGKTVNVDAVVEAETVAVGGKQISDEEKTVADGMMWFKSNDNVGGENSVALTLAIVDRMKWEAEQFGWINGGNQRQVRVKRFEEFGGNNGEWKKFGCYVLVERFVLRRMNGSLVLTFNFRHTQHLRTNWE